MENALIAIAIGLLIWFALIGCLLALLRFTAGRDQDADDADACIAASRPAELRPHVRAFTEPRI